MSALRKLRNLVELLPAKLFRRCKISSLEVSPRSLADAVAVEVSTGTSVDAQSRIGSYTFVGRNSHITKSTIGRYCSIANNVSIGQGEHLLGGVSTSSLFYEDAWNTLTQKDCIIENDVWIGVDAVILRGVKIGVGAVVAANSVVTKDVAPYAIVAGVPARTIRYRLDEAQQAVLLKSRWWEKEFGEAKELISRLGLEFVRP